MKMLHKGQKYELVRALERNGIEYAVFFHEKSHRNSFWVFLRGGWVRIADVYSVPEFLKYARRNETTKLFSLAQCAAWLTAGLVLGALIVTITYHLPA